ncbi:NTP transferase domain-containing protein [Ammoniphilus sp. CFH 90114]|uniref:nucleotidyltransferase family protein n=1 Tax=Ammoniphilus sp. CFH 90114 TaxID=2493665 RepID=UPI00100EF143|nr:nucleotidyltransferase family protein [Ammoniphilus sp. CFH 90114]RXT06411.1 nucleotidyltransferase family protein [Ammoniphilus sp. CFH 90114]
MMNSISAVILAAGMSTRMGECKPLIKHKGKTFLEHAIELARSVEVFQIAIVVGHEKERIQEQIQIQDSRLRWIYNPDYIKGQSYSLKAGWHSLGSSPGVMVFLADMPLIEKRTVNMIFEEGRKKLHQKSSFVVQPCHYGTKGHPVFFGHIGLDALELLEGDTGGKSLISSVPNYYGINIDDKGIYRDFDTPEELNQLNSEVNVHDAL